MTKKRIAIERLYQAPIEDVWDLWTTKDGIESWWGPDGFSVTVRHLDLRPGGELRYGMTATEPDKIAFMERAGMPTTTECVATYKEVSPHVRLAYLHRADFIPGVAPYDVEHVVELSATAAGVRMVLTLEAMHDAEWTQRAVTGWKNELDGLAASLAERAAARRT